MKLKLLSVLAALSLVLVFLPGMVPHAHAEESAPNARQAMSPDYDGGVINRHTDFNKDGYCDICPNHHLDHTYENSLWYADQTYHYPVCTVCEEYDETAGVLHSDEDENLFCDTCGQNVCKHAQDYVPTANGDGTHTGFCYTCSNTITEPCDKTYGQDWDETGHWDTCFCGYAFPDSAKKHTFQYKNCEKSIPAGHWLVCDNCYYECYEAHTKTIGTCGTCGNRLGTVYDVYVAGVGLNQGRYLDTTGHVTDTKPEGGYAYYKNGVLELNNFTNGDECGLWLDHADNAYYAAVFATKDLMLNLVGQNSLTSPATGYDEILDTSFYGDGLASVGDLTIQGPGSLTVSAANDGMRTEGDITISGGTVTVQSGNLGISGSSVTVSGGSVTVDALTLSALSARLGSVTITGDYLELTAGIDAVVTAKKGIAVEGDVALPKGVTVTMSETGSLIPMEVGTTLIIASPFSVELKGNILHLTKTPQGLTVLVAAYDSEGKLVALQVEDTPGEIVEITVTGETVSVFFLNAGSAPIRETLAVT